MRRDFAVVCIMIICVHVRGLKAISIRRAQ